MRRDYESLYALGVAFTAFAAAEAVGGSGFLAAFAAGLVIAALDVELCDCFLDYGEASAEMFLLLTFVAFGASLIWTGFEVADVPTLLFAVLALGVRTAVLLPVLRLRGHRAAEPADHRLVRAAGPELAAAGAAAGVRGSRRARCGCSRSPASSCCSRCVLHGGGIAIFLRRGDADGRPPATPAARPGRRSRSALADSSAPRPSPIGAPTDGDGARADHDRRAPRLWEQGEPVTVLDVRTERSYRDDPQIAAGAIRMPPDDAVRLARERRLDQNATLVLYCT